MDINADSLINEIMANQITISELQRKKEEHGSVYVFNTSDLRHVKNINKQDRGEILITIIDKSESVLIKIPNTWIPIDLTEYVSRESILSSPDFRKLINSGRVVLVDTEFAEKILKHPEAISERTMIRVTNSNMTVRDATENLGAVKPSNRPPEIAFNQGQMIETTASTKIINICNSVTKPDELLTALKSLVMNTGSISEIDKAYIINQYSNNDSYKKVIKFITELNS